MDWPREQSVGTMVSFEHVAPTPPGMTLRIEGEVTEVEGRRVRFKIEAWDDVERICSGTHERHVIDPARFAARLAQKKAAA
jgi:fluoroacetyl-CoA thioesterase